MRDVANVKYDFTGHVVLITGGARGQGKNHALSFAEAGADVVIADIGRGMETVEYALATTEELEATADEVRAFGVRCQTATCDVRDRKQVQAMVDAAIAEFGKIDVLINNAAIESLPTVAEMTEEAWDEMIDTDLKGAFLCSKYVSEHMVKAGSGNIISTGSASSTVGLPRQAHFCAAKHGLVGFTKALALELAPQGINVNMVCPGGTDTAMAAGLVNSRVGTWLTEDVPALIGPYNVFDPHAMLDTQDITNAMLWMASDASRYVTGATLYVDAGMTIK